MRKPPESPFFVPPAPLTEEGYCALVHFYSPELHGYLLKESGGRELVAEDVLQATFEVVWEKRADYWGGNPRAWLYSIATIELKDHERKEARLPRLSEAPIDSRLPLPPDDSVQPPEPRPTVLNALQRCIASLKEADQTIARLKSGLRVVHEDGVPRSSFSYFEIACIINAELGMWFSPDRVRMRYKRALMALRKCMKNEGCRSFGECSSALED